MKRIALIALLVLGLLVGGCGETHPNRASNVSRGLCEQIEWQGRQCETLDEELMRETLREVQRQANR